MKAYSPSIFPIAAINTVPINNSNINAIGIQSGEKTHHQDHVATTPIPASLSTKNIRNSTVPIPIPFDVSLLMLC